MTLLMMMIACPKPGIGPDNGSPVLADEAPVLPSPDARIYTRAPGSPGDPLVAQVAQGIEYDEALAGAAAAFGMEMALHEGKADRAALHWALIRAGWPYGVDGVLIEGTGYGQAPTESFVADLKAFTGPVGVARVRGANQDWWIAIQGFIDVELSAFPREYQVGDQLQLGTTDPGGWSELAFRTLSPTGTITVGPQSFSEPGEWLLELTGTAPTGHRAPLARLPLYVGIETPNDGPFLGPGQMPEGAEGTAQVALDTVNILRDLLDVPELELDPILTAVARNEAQRLSESGPSSDREAAIRGAGFADGPVAEISCTGNSVQDCVDEMFWSIDDRLALGEAAYNLAGVGHQWTVDGLVLVVSLAP